MGGAPEVCIPERLGLDGLATHGTNELAGLEVNGVGMVDATSSALLSKKGTCIRHVFGAGFEGSKENQRRTDEPECVVR